MNLKNLNLKRRYRSFEDNLIRDFYLPVLENAEFYKRAVGYFSSTALCDVSRGLTKIAQNKGKVQVIASPYLKEEDIEAINKGYEERDKVIERSIMEHFTEPIDYYQEKRLNLLAYLIAEGILDIKIAFLENQGYVGLYHEKIGVVRDNLDNKIAFTGSLNESSSAFKENFESIDVFCSWKGEDSLERVKEKEEDFDNLWSNNTKKIKVIEFPEIAKEKLKTYQKETIDWYIDEKEQKIFQIKETTATYSIKKYPRTPDKVKLYEYQKEAIKSFEENNFKGIFSMATGTGKTITGLAAISRLYEAVDNRLAIIIVCPYQHLVEQWVEDIIEFNLSPIIGYSTSSQKNWKDRLKDAVIDYNLKVIDNFCFVTTNATYASDFVQKQINKIKDNAIIVVDEAHNFGAYNLSTKLNDKIPYRLALSATMERHGDPEGTEKLYNYFGQECINYPLKRAIKENKLVPYYYYPVLTHLTPNELDEYKQLTDQISKCLKTDKKGNIVLNEKGKMLAIKRARHVAGSVNKLKALREKILLYQNYSHILVYCGATTLSDIDYQEDKAHPEEMRQITAVSDILGNELGMNVSKFTSEENSQEREILKEEFAKGETLQALAAIKCLDEGVNIPNIKTAFILASSTNPKEYIQRRGRLLRLAPNKYHAVIYDFITVPRPLEEVKNLPDHEINNDISLVKKEITRIQDFADLAINFQDSHELISRLKESYNLYACGGGVI